MRISKAIKPILVALGAQASEIGGKSLSKIANYVAPFAVDFIEKTKSGEYGGNDEFVITFIKDEGSWSSDHTYAEALEAYNSGKTLVGKFNIYDVIENVPEGGSGFLKAYLIAAFKDIPADESSSMDAFSFTNSSYDYVLNVLLVHINDVDVIDVHKTTLSS